MGLTTTIMPPPRKPSSKPFQFAPSYQSELSDAQKFGKRLQALRHERGLTQLQLAVATELDRSYISDLERGIKAPTLTTMRDIADVFMISISELCRGI